MFGKQSKFIWNFKGYRLHSLPRDVIAAITVTAIAIPESLGFAVVAGLPLVSGLYCALVAPLVFALLTSSKRVVVGADSATAALVAAGASAIAVVGTAEYGSAVVTLGILTSFILLTMAFFKFGFLVNFISKPVLVGFLGGVGVQLMLGKIPELFGITSTGSVVERLWYTLGHLADSSLLTISVSGIVILISLFIGKSRFPGVLAGLLTSIVLSIGLGLGDAGLAMVGSLPAGLPRPTMAALAPQHILWLLPTAITIALVVVAQGMSIIRDMATEHDEKTFMDQDILAFGAANAVSALTQGFAINGSPPRSLASELAGGTSQMVNVLMSVFVGIIILFASDIFRFVPMAALAAIVFVIGIHLIRVSDFKQIYHTRRTEFFIAITTLLLVALLGVRQGLFIAIIISLLERLHRQYLTSDQILLRDGELSDWAKERVHVDYQESHTTKGLLIYRFNGSIFFDNARYFAHRVKDAVRGAKQPVTGVIIDAGAIDDIDYTAVESIRKLYTTLKKDDIQLGFAHVSPHLGSELRRYGVVDIIGRRHIYSTLNQALTTYGKNPRDVVTMLEQLDLPRKQFVVIGGAVMAGLGLRATHSADLVVTNELYAKLRDEQGWHEYAQENGKCILNKEGFHAMQSWLGWHVHDLSDDALTIGGVQYMHPRKLVEGKERLGRPKDLEDIKLLKHWLEQAEKPQ